ncbi:chaplin [Yinghuangia soli]|uniref:Chaplin n=1 Tax=Yinghuangia soli TaxID=2908204 RepID=A0AA41TZZ0_9ACTN|nr:chaplin [Yinghuangia soli]MCF2527820.1 chaplin [Yinghuangia soli]
MGNISVNEFAKKTVVTAAMVGSVFALGGGVAQASSSADGAATGSPGVLSGNLVQVPVHVPVNLCGNSVDVIGVLNPAFGNTCVNAEGPMAPPPHHPPHHPPACPPQGPPTTPPACPPTTPPPVTPPPVTPPPVTPPPVTPPPVTPPPSEECPSDEECPCPEVQVVHEVTDAVSL